MTMEFALAKRHCHRMKIRTFPCSLGVHCPQNIVCICSTLFAKYNWNFFTILFDVMMHSHVYEIPPQSPRWSIGFLRIVTDGAQRLMVRAQCWLRDETLRQRRRPNWTAVLGVVAAELIIRWSSVKPALVFKSTPHGEPGFSYCSNWISK